MTTKDRLETIEALKSLDRKIKRDPKARRAFFASLGIVTKNGYMTKRWKQILGPPYIRI